MLCSLLKAIKILHQLMLKLMKTYLDRRELLMEVKLSLLMEIMP